MLKGSNAKPYWWEAAPRPEPDDTKIPATTDVLVVGSGYTGLQAAIQTARGGRSTVVVDAEAAGYGCSSRNGGQVSTSIKPFFAALERLHGREVAYGIRTEGIKALDYLESFIAGENLDCDWGRVGRFHGAYHRKHYESLARDMNAHPKGLEIEAHMVPRMEQHREIGTDFYHGGVVFPRHASLHPGKYHLGLLALARSSGARVVSHCPVNAIDATRNGFLVSTATGRVHAKDVIIATNGYTKSLTPWNQRRVIPIGSYMIATEPLDPALVSKLCPKSRVMSDTRKLVFYYRICPEKRRILFGGQSGTQGNQPRYQRATFAQCHVQNFSGAAPHPDQPFVDGVCCLYLRCPASLWGPSGCALCDGLLWVRGFARQLLWDADWAKSAGKSRW